MTLLETLRLALDALESTGHNDGTHGETQFFDDALVDEALPALRSTIEQVEKEEQIYVDYPTYHEEAMGCGLEDRNITNRYDAMQYGWDKAVERVFEQLPDGPLYTTPQPRQWVGLSDEEARRVVLAASLATGVTNPSASALVRFTRLARETEAALRQKNGG